MKGAVLYGPRDVRFEELADPTIVKPATRLSAWPRRECAVPTCGRTAARNPPRRRHRWATSIAASSRRSGGSTTNPSDHLPRSRSGCSPNVVGRCTRAAGNPLTPPGAGESRGRTRPALLTGSPAAAGCRAVHVPPATARSARGICRGAPQRGSSSRPDPPPHRTARTPTRRMAGRA